MKVLTPPLGKTEGFLSIEGRTLFSFERNTGGVRRNASPAVSETFRLRIEPWGVYMVEKTARNHWMSNPSTHYGVVDYRKALFIEQLDWKDTLSLQQGGKKGKALSNALLKEGYDLIITHDKYGTSEVCALDEPRIFRYNPYQVYEKVSGAHQDTASPIRALSCDQIESRKRLSPETLSFVNPGLVLPVSELQWGQDSEDLRKKATAAGFNSIAVVDDLLPMKLGIDQIRPYNLIPLTQLETFDIGDSIWLKKGLSSNSESPTHVGFDQPTETARLKKTSSPKSP